MTSLPTPPLHHSGRKMFWRIENSYYYSSRGPGTGGIHRTTPCPELILMVEGEDLVRDVANPDRMWYSFTLPKTIQETYQDEPYTVVSSTVMWKRGNEYLPSTDPKDILRTADALLQRYEVLREKQRTYNNYTQQLNNLLGDYPPKEL